MNSNQCGIYLLDSSEIILQAMKIEGWHLTLGLKSGYTCWDF